MRLKPLLASAALTVALGACAVTPEGELVTMFDPPAYPDYAAQASAIADYSLMLAIMRHAQCSKPGADCNPTLNVNIR